MNEIEIFKAKSGDLTVLYNNRLLHSKYNPVKEAKKMVEFYSKSHNDKLFVIYGLGIGYHIIEILKHANKNAKIYIFEFNNKLVEINIQLGIIELLSKDDRVTMYLEYKEGIIELSKIMKNVKNIIIHEPSVATLGEEFNEFKLIVEKYNIGKKAIKKFSDIMKINEEKNFMLQDYEIQRFIKRSNDLETIILVAAGPSLDNHLKMLNNINDKVGIFTVGRALNALMKNKILADMICEIDPSELIYEHIRGYENLNIPLCYLSTANNFAISQYNGPRYIFYNERKSSGLIIDTGKSVATAMLSIAIECKPKNIIFLGQDLAYIDGKSHTKLTDEREIEISKGVVTTLGVSGDIVETTRGLLYFKGWIENIIKENKSINFYNCSEGANIEGTKNVGFNEIIKKYRMA